MNVYNYNHLFYFYIIAKLNGITAAASHLNTSQSSLSTQIKTLEAMLNKKLFKKVGRQLELTDTGREVYAYCRRAFEVFDEMTDQIFKKDLSMGVRISIGVSIEIERPFVTEILSKLSRQYSKGRRPLFNLISLDSTQLLQKLKIGELDLLLTDGLVIDSEVENIVDLDFPVGLFIPPDVSFKYKICSAESLLSKLALPFVLPSKTTTLRTEIDQFFIHRKVRPVCLFESNVMSAVVRAASDGLGATMLPVAYVSRELKTGRLVTFHDKILWKHRMSIVSTRLRINDDKRQFIDKLADYLKSNLLVDNFLKK